MKGKLIFVAGLATGYVLGTRAGRERYEQIKKGWLSVWNTEPVQNQVEKVQKLAKARISAVPSAVFSGIGKVVSTLTSDGTPGQKLDKTIAETKGTVDEIKDAVDEGASSTRGGSASSGTPSSAAKSSK
ncbi:hypothetical protein GCM10027416_02860 [Okibacterium endophyticum]